jgi:DNA-binding MarR family transcriptional regulator
VTGGQPSPAPVSHAQPSQAASTGPASTSPASTSPASTSPASTSPASTSTERHRLAFDPIEEAARQWAGHWDQMPRMRAVTSLMRVHQLVLTELDELLRPLGLTFARYEVLVLLSFSRRGALPLGKIGERLQVHATSVTPLVKRLERAELITRTPHPEDGRAVLASITPKGRLVMQQATDRIVAARFALSSLTEADCDRLTDLLTAPRSAAGDF